MPQEGKENREQNILCLKSRKGFIKPAQHSSFGGVTSTAQNKNRTEAVSPSHDGQGFELSPAVPFLFHTNSVGDFYVHAFYTI